MQNDLTRGAELHSIYAHGGPSSRRPIANNPSEARPDEDAIIEESAC